MLRLVEVACFIAGVVLFALPGSLPKLMGACLLVLWVLLFFHRSEPPPTEF